MLTIARFLLEKVNSRPSPIESLLHLNGRPRADARSLLLKRNNLLFKCN